MIFARRPIRDAFLTSTVLVATALAVACSSGSGTDGRDDPTKTSFKVTGKVVLPRTGNVATRVVVQAQDGTFAGAGNSAPDGSFSIQASIPKGATRLLAMAVLPSDPEERVVAVFDLFSATEENVTLDTRSTAVALLVAATGDMGAHLGDVEGTNLTKVDSLKSSISAGALRLCTAEATTTTGASALFSPIADVVDDGNVGDAATAPFLTALAKRAAETGDTAARIADVRKAISDGLRALPQGGGSEPAKGSIPHVLARMAVASMTTESFADVVDQAISEKALAQIVRVIAGTGNANCRERAYVGAFAGSRMPEMKQVAVVAFATTSKVPAVVALGCTDGPEAFDLADLSFGAGAFTPAGAGAGRCWVLDRGAASAADAGAVQPKPLDAAFAAAEGWEAVLAVKPVELERVNPKPKGGGRTARGCDCASTSECAPFALPSGGSSPGAPVSDASTRRD